MPHTRLSLAKVSRREAARVTRILRNEFASGIAVMAAALLGFLAANSPLAGAYMDLRDFRIGPDSLNLNLSLGTWAADGLLAVFFFMVGLELKREFVTGALSKFTTAIVPVAAAFGGVALPALIYLAFTFGTEAAHGWAIPAATDIAFAVAILGLIAPRIPTALRIFLLTLAVVDDLIAISIIAIFYTSGVQFAFLALALVPLALYAFLARRFAAWFADHRWAAWAILLPLGIVVWALVHESGVHATIAGVVLAFTVPVVSKPQKGAPRVADTDHENSRESLDLAHLFGYRFGPLSSGFAVPVFAFFAAGVAVGGENRFPFDPIAFGIIAGLVIGKTVGISATTWAILRFTRAELGGDASWREVIGVAALGGIGFTVSLLIADLSFTDPADADTARLAVMVASLIAAAVAAALLVRKPRARATQLD